MRTCIGCRRATTPAELVRVVRRVDGTLAVGRTLAGRGAWLCAGSVACVEQARSRGAFGRALRGPVSEAALDTLTAELLPGAAASLSCRRERPRED
ncbi:MAG: YlxR family protein [Microthrixaceae bacterium]|nr:YlxR family protein [Microthrixaceae bacterium]